MKTIKKLFEDYSTLYADKVMFENSGDVNYTFSQLREKVREMQSMLYYYGVRKGDKVGLLMPDSPRWMIAFFAVVNMGAVVIPVTSYRDASTIMSITNAVNCKFLILADGILSQNTLAKLKDDTHLTIIDSERLKCVISPIVSNDYEPCGYDMFSSLTLPVAVVNPFELAVQCVVFDGFTTAVDSFSHEELYDVVMSKAKCYQNNAFDKEDVYLSILPLSVMDKKIVNALIPVVNGCKTVFIKQQLGFNSIINALYDVKPSIIITAPRFIEMVYNSNLVNVKVKNIQTTKSFFQKLFSKLSLKKQGEKLYKSLGGEVRCCLVNDKYNETVAEFIDASGLSTKMTFMCV